MSGIVLNLATARRLIDEAIAERGEDYVYEKPEGYDICSYVHLATKEGDEAEAGCGVGLALLKAGVSLSALEEHEGKPARMVIPALCAEGHIKNYSQRALYFLQDFQSKQDIGGSWGVARNYAVRGEEFRTLPSDDLIA